jgi:tricarballylate dehydrogenase
MRDIIGDIPETERVRMDMPPYPAEQFHADLLATTSGRIDSSLASALVDESNSAVRWMKDLGIEWQLEKPVEVDGRLKYEPGMSIQPVGGMQGGLSQLQRWREIALRRGIEIRYDSAVIGLQGSERGVDGVRVLHEGTAYELLAGAVILCSGGFQANRELRRKYLGSNADLMKVRGSRHDTGEVLQMALDLGAMRGGDWNGAHVTPVDAASDEFGSGNVANRYSYPYGITVNRQAKRFFDEGEAHSWYTYAKTGWAVLRQPGAVAYQLFDQGGLQWLRRYAYDHAVPTEASSLGLLATALDLDPIQLEATVAEFNHSIADDRPFDPARADGRSTRGLEPPKSNWSLAIERAPFRAYGVTAGITFTFGGLAINRHAEVLGPTGDPIPGLFASGDAIGLFHGNYPAGAGQIRNAVFSRIAGRRAAQRPVSV